MSLAAFAFLVTALLFLFDQLAVLFPVEFEQWKRLALIAEAFLPLSWYLFSIAFSRRVDEPEAIPPIQKLLLVAMLLFPVAVFSMPLQDFFISPDFADERMLFLGNPGFILYIGILLAMVIALVNLEATLLTSSGSARWRIKFETIGAGALIAFFIFYYSQGLLYRSINMNLLPVRSFVLIISVAMIAVSRSRGAGDVRLSISRKTAYRSVVVFLVGIYLIGLGLLGEGMKYIGRESQNKLLVSVAFVAAIGLLLVLFSEKAKRRITVFLHKNFYQNKFDYRVQWLQFTDRLASAKTGEDLLTSILEGFRDTFGMSGAALFFFDEDRRVYALRSSIGIASSTLPIKTDDALIRNIKERQWVLNVHDDNADIPGHDREFLIGSDIIFLVPLFFGEDLRGFIALGRPINPREVYTYEDYDLMKTLARQAASAILNLKLSEELAESRQMEAVGKISAFVLHDLKNLVSALSLMMENAKDYMDDPDFQRDMIRSLDNTVSKMKRLIERLKNIQDKDALRYENVDLRALVLETASLVTTAQISVSGEGICVDVDREEMQKVILNLLLNGIEACNGKGTVSADVGPLRAGDNGSACIRVSDTGSGMSEEFIRNSLFKPFVTTKGKGLGIGLYQCRQIVEAHRGRIDVKSEVGKGSVFTVILPKSANQACLLHDDE